MPSCFIDIMTLRPEVRKSEMAVCVAGSTTSTTPPHLRCGWLQPKPRSAISSPKLLELCQIVGLIFFGEFDDQQRIGIAAHGSIDHRPEHRNVAAERDHGPVDQFHGDWPQLHQMLGGIHRLIKAAEMADAEHLVADHGPELQLDLGRKGERAFRAYQQVRHVVRGVARHQRVEIVAADPALHFWKFFRDLGRLALAEVEHVAKQL